ncbi:hypothetical protein G3I40_10945, partial [Streptomyces sp. SID14478]|uniref:hypothetical protein n=1 Tax=Streptomyces sp. SID14478 TaxID=2706073 RepID=UPI0013DB4DAB
RERGPDAGRPTPESAREAYLSGQPVDWQALFAPHTPHRLRLPGYPFDETDLWFTDEGRTA